MRGEGSHSLQVWGVVSVRTGQGFIWGTLLFAYGVNRMTVTVQKINKWSLPRIRHDKYKHQRAIVLQKEWLTTVKYVTPSQLYVSQRIWKTAENTVGLLSMLHVLKRSHSSLQLSTSTRRISLIVGLVDVVQWVWVSEWMSWYSGS